MIEIHLIKHIFLISLAMPFVAVLLTCMVRNIE